MRSFKFEIETLSESLWTMLFYKLIVTKQMTVLKKKGITEKKVTEKEVLKEKQSDKRKQNK